MHNEFRKLLNKEFGKDEYNAYVEYVNRMFQRQKMERRTKPRVEAVREEEMLRMFIFKSMEKIMDTKSKPQIGRAAKRLSDSMRLIMEIHRQFLFVVLAYIASVAVLLLLSLHPWVSAAAIVFLTICLLYKAWEYVANKYCYTDAYLVVIYKDVLKKLIENRQL